MTTAWIVKKSSHTVKEDVRWMEEVWCDGKFQLALRVIIKSAGNFLYSIKILFFIIMINFNAFPQRHILFCLMKLYQQLHNFVRWWLSSFFSQHPSQFYIWNWNISEIHLVREKEIFFAAIAAVQSLIFHLKSTKDDWRERRKKYFPFHLTFHSLNVEMENLLNVNGTWPRQNEKNFVEDGKKSFKILVNLSLNEKQ